MMIFDSSYAVNRNSWSGSYYYEMRHFAYNLLKRIKQDSDRTLYSILTYANVTNIACVFETCPFARSFASFYTLSWHSSHRRRNRTNTADALNTALSVFSNFTHEDSRKVAVVFTDGKSDDPHATQKEAKRLRENNVTVYSVGFGYGINEEELRAISSDPDEYYVLIGQNLTEPSDNLPYNTSALEDIIYKLCIGKYRLLLLYLIFLKYSIDRRWEVELKFTVSLFIVRSE